MAGKVLAIVGICLYVIFMVSLLSYTTAHEKGYMKGARDAKLYHEATDMFPSQWWLDRAEGKHFTYPQEVLKTLEGR